MSSAGETVGIAADSLVGVRAGLLIGSAFGYNTLMSKPLTVDAGALRAEIGGEVVAAGDPAWDDARQAWNLVAEQRPMLVVQPTCVEEVVATVRFAAANGLRVAPQCFGHGATSLGELDGAILLRTTGLIGVTVDAAQRTATVRAGARWRDLNAPAAEHGLVGLHGMSGGVGVIGYALGGGIGWLSRLHGLASTHVTSLEAVTADGEQRHVDADSEPDLFWALRGGGGGPAIVTSLEIGLFELRKVFAGALMWPLERASEIVHAYREWTLFAPDEVTSTIKLLRFPPLPEIPGPLRGRELVAITLAFAGSEADGVELVEPLRALAKPYLHTLATMPAAALGDLAGDPQNPGPAIGNGLLLEKFTAETADAYVELAGPGVRSPFVALELRHLGGALRSATPDPGSGGPLQATALVYATGLPVTQEVGAALQTSLDAVGERLSPWIGERRALLTFDERGRGLRDAFTAPVADRLVSITRSYDPHGLFIANHVAD